MSELIITDCATLLWAVGENICELQPWRRSRPFELITHNDHHLLMHSLRAFAAVSFCPMKKANMWKLTKDDCTVFSSIDAPLKVVTYLPDRCSSTPLRRSQKNIHASVKEGRHCPWNRHQFVYFSIVFFLFLEKNLTMIKVAVQCVASNEWFSNIGSTRPFLHFPTDRGFWNIFVCFWGKFHLSRPPASVSPRLS